MEKAAAQKGVWQFLFIIGCDDHHRAIFGGDRFTRFIDVKGHLIQFLQQVIWEFDICLINFINQQNNLLVCLKRGP